MIRLDDLDDPRLADFRLVADPAALARAGLFVAEGRLILPRVLDAPRFRLRAVLLSDAAWAALGADLAAAAAPVYVVPQARMNALAGFNIHRGCLALVERPALPALAAIDLGACRRVLVLEGVNNPDNVGGIFRNAAAFDVDLAVLGPGCGDPFYRKAIRTSMGAALSVPLAAAGAWPADLARLRAAGLALLALTPAADATPLTALAADRLPRVALLLGAEGPGLSAAALAAAELRVRVESGPRVDSLNVATAAAIALHHFSAGAARAID